MLKAYQVTIEFQKYDTIMNERHNETFSYKTGYTPVFYHTFCLGKPSKKKTEKSDIVHIWV